MLDAPVAGSLLGAVGAAAVASPRRSVGTKIAGTRLLRLLDQDTGRVALHQRLSTAAIAFAVGCGKPDEIPRAGVDTTGRRRIKRRLDRRADVGRRVRNAAARNAPLTRCARGTTRVVGLALAAVGAHALRTAGHEITRTAGHGGKCHASCVGALAGAGVGSAALHQAAADIGAQHVLRPWRRRRVHDRYTVAAARGAAGQVGSGGWGEL